MTARPVLSLQSARILLSCSYPIVLSSALPEILTFVLHSFTPRRLAPLRLAPLRSASVRSASVRSECWFIDGLKLAPMSSALLRSAYERFIPWALTTSRLTSLLNFASIRFALLIFASYIHALLKISFLKFGSRAFCFFFRKILLLPVNSKCTRGNYSKKFA